jgi:MoxR-like ATPase
MFKLLIDYPAKAEEKQIMQRVGFEPPAEVKAVLEPDALNEIYRLINAVYMDDKLRDYIVDLVFATRKPADYGIEMADYIQYGASPRATIFLSLAARAYAFLQERAYVTPQDVKTIAPWVLRHRIIPTYEAEAEDITTDQIVQRIFDSVPVP